MTEKELAKKIEETFKIGDKVYIVGRDLFSAYSKQVTIKSIDYKKEEIIASLSHVNYRCQFKDFLKAASFTEYTLEPVGFSQERPKPKKRNGEPFEVGDEVWGILVSGLFKGKIIDNTNHKYYPLIVEFLKEPDYFFEVHFGLEGEYIHEGEPRLFHQKPIIKFE